jgi:hypothetical protein
MSWVVGSVLLRLVLLGLSVHRAFPLHISVEGWRFMKHSYAIVNQFQLLELMKVDGVQLTVADSPAYHTGQQRGLLNTATTLGIFSEEQEAALRALPLTNSSTFAPPDVVLRVAYPIDLSPAVCGAANTW